MRARSIAPWLSVAVVAALVPPATAQSRTWVGGGVGVGVGVGPGWSYHNLPGGPYVAPAPFFGYYPGAYHTHWTNGLTLYGPPVPTFGPTPGAFGGHDAHRHYFAGGPPRFGWFGYYTPSPRPKHLSVDVYPPAHLTGPGYDTVAPREAIPVSPNCLRLCVKVPAADAAVWIDGQPTTATGAERWFESPPLTPGQEYRYQVTAKWADGKIDTKTATGKPGESVTVAFGEEAKRP